MPIERCNYSSCDCDMSDFDNSCDSVIRVIAVIGVLGLIGATDSTNLTALRSEVDLASAYDSSDDA